MYPNYLEELLAHCRNSINICWNEPITISCMAMSIIKMWQVLYFSSSALDCVHSTSVDYWGWTCIYNLIVCSLNSPQRCLTENTASTHTWNRQSKGTALLLVSIIQIRQLRCSLTWCRDRMITERRLTKNVRWCNLCLKSDGKGAAIEAGLQWGRMIKERFRGKNVLAYSQGIKEIYDTMAEAMKSSAEGVNVGKGRVYHRHLFF